MQTEKGAGWEGTEPGLQTWMPWDVGRSKIIELIGA